MRAPPQIRETVCDVMGNPVASVLEVHGFNERTGTWHVSLSSGVVCHVAWDDFKKKWWLL
jgi:hypothetical protein